MGYVILKMHGCMFSNNMVAHIYIYIYIYIYYLYIYCYSCTCLTFLCLLHIVFFIYIHVDVTISCKFSRAENYDSRYITGKPRLVLNKRSPFSFRMIIINEEDGTAHGESPAKFVFKST